jgi:hypothetical protein
MKFLIPVLLLCLSVLNADTLKLRNGTVLQGRFVAGDERSVWFQTGTEGANPYPLNFVESISFGGVTPLPSAYAPARTTKVKKMPNLREALWLIPAP